MSGFQPELFGRYRLVERIATGGMAEILLARSVSLSGVEQACVIKRILPEHTRDVAFISLFIDEARITIGLDHKNIVRLYDFGQHECRYYMAIEYVDGTDLSQLMRVHGRQARGLGLATAVFIARELLLGLHHAHTLSDASGRPLGIVHRDVSPQNVLLSSAGAVKLADFGIAAAKHKLTLTSPGTVLGKTGYMAPEQATGSAVDLSADVWSVGVVLHEMLTGERLFTADSPLLTLQRVTDAVLEPPSSVRSEVPGTLDRIVLKALQRNPRHRYASALAMANELDAWLVANPVHGRPFGEKELAHELAHLDWTDSTKRMRAPQTGVVNGSVSHPDGGEDPRLRELLDGLRAVPNLWTLVAIGDRLHDLGRTAEALSAWRTAAALFAHRGLLIQAICAHHRTRTALDDELAQKDLMALGALRVEDRRELADLMAVFDRHGFWRLLQELDPAGPGSSRKNDAAPVAPVPLLSSLDPPELVRLARGARVLQVRGGDVVIREGELGDSLFAVGHGRLVVWTRTADGGALELQRETGQFERLRSIDDTKADATVHSRPDGRIYVGSLSDGDFFGEFSFLTERPRSATVEAVVDGVLLEFDRALFGDMVKSSPSFTEPLAQFYKERVVELMMAKNPVFSLLDLQDRRQLLQSSVLVEFQDEELIVEEGTLDDHFYFIKRGEVEIFRRDQRGSPIFINKLGQGQFFGEIAALRGTPRMVSVKAMGGLSLLRIDRSILLGILDREPHLKSLLEETIAQRTEEMRERIREHQLLFVGT